MNVCCAVCIERYQAGRIYRPRTPGTCPHSVKERRSVLWSSESSRWEGETGRMTLCDPCEKCDLCCTLCCPVFGLGEEAWEAHTEVLDQFHHLFDVRCSMLFLNFEKCQSASDQIPLVTADVFFVSGELRVGSRWLVGMLYQLEGHHY